MLEIKVLIEAPELAASINNLATALSKSSVPFVMPQVPDEVIGDVIDSVKKQPVTFMPEDVVKVEPVAEQVEEKPKKASKAKAKKPEEAKEEPVQQEEKPEPVQQEEKSEPVQEEKTEEAPAPEVITVTRDMIFERCKTALQSKKITSATLSDTLHKYNAPSIPSLKDEDLAPFWLDLDALGV